MPLSEPMKAAMLLAAMLAILAMATLVSAVIISSGLGALTSAVKAETIGTYAGFGGFAGGIFVFEDILRVVWATANTLKNHLPLLAGATAFALSLPS
ncbi:unnamed protein product [Symbiodinium microadriaticum]|nr:unnamed protein product [Symbiodinium sp. KB8]CAE7889151.1 unnamed protein product [Symbiodinium microadriaticum]